MLWDTLANLESLIKGVNVQDAENSSYGMNSLKINTEREGINLGVRIVSENMKGGRRRKNI